MAAYFKALPSLSLQTIHILSAVGLLILGSLSWYSVSKLSTHIWTPLPASHKERSLIIAVTHHDDIGWLKSSNLVDNYDVYPYWMDRAALPSGYQTPATYEGREAAAYLSFIIDHYDNLPQYSFFLHSHTEQWHNDVTGPRMDKLLSALRMNVMDREGYVNLRCKHDPGCPDGIRPDDIPEQDSSDNNTRAQFTSIYQHLLNEDVPDVLANICCGQFVVTRDQIRQRPIDDYLRMLVWLRTYTEVDAYWKGWVFEKIWHRIFGMDAQYCPDEEQCRCDLYNVCGPLEDGWILTPAES